MRIVSLVFATLFLLGTTALGILGARRSLVDAKDIDKVYAPVKAEITALAKSGDPDAKKIQALGEKTGMLRVGAVFFGLVALGAVALLVTTFMGRGVGVTALGLIGASIVAVVVNPAYDLGPLAPASARELAYVVAVFAILGAAAAYGSAALKRRRQAAASPAIPEGYAQAA